MTSPLAVSMSSAPVLPSTPHPPSPVKNALPATKVTSDSLVIFNKYLLDLILLDLFVEFDNGGDFLKTFVRMMSSGFSFILLADSSQSSCRFVFLCSP